MITMKYLIDTHAFLWFINGETLLSETARLCIEDPFAKKYISIASLWEIAIKFKLGRLELKLPYTELVSFARSKEIVILPIRFKHLCKLLSLHLFHRDPFDRILISQTLCEKLVIISKDAAFASYSAPTIW